MGRDHVLLLIHGLSCHQLALLEYYGGVTEDEINGAGDEGVTVELPVGVSVESILIGVNAAAVNDGLVGTDAEGHGLVLLWACCILEAHVLGYKPIPNGSCRSRFIITYTVNFLRRPILIHKLKHICSLDQKMKNKCAVSIQAFDILVRSLVRKR